MPRPRPGRTPADTGTTGVAVHEFDALVEPVLRSRATYTVVRLPAALVDDVEAALVEAELVEADLLGAREALTPAAGRRRLYAVDSAASPATRARRLAALLDGLGTRGRGVVLRPERAGGPTAVR